MSGDHNMNQTDSGWRKRQIALDKKAKNARELGLDYEPNKTVIEMAREAGFELDCVSLEWHKRIEAFAKLVREDEREACAKVCEAQEDEGGEWDIQQQCANAIRARGDQA
jgi:hypothetical protein